MTARSFSKIATVACAAIICIGFVGFVGCSGAVSSPATTTGQQPSEPPAGEPPAGAEFSLSAATSDSRPSAGAQFTLFATVRNDGEGTLPAVTLRFYRSTDATITTADTEVGTGAVASLAASGSASDSLELTAPSTPGTYYYGACVDTVTEESDTTNNCSASVQVMVPEPELHPDLAVASISVSDGAPVVGATFTLSATVRNDGKGGSERTTLRYYQSRDARITTSDTEVSTDAMAELAALGSASGSVELTAPANAGTYYFGVCVDAVKDESDTTNNCSTSIQVTVQATVTEPQGHPDLMVGTPSVSDNGPAAGASFTLSATVRNDGDGSSEATTLRYYRSTDATITASDMEVGTDAVTGLGAAGSSSQSVDLTAPATPGRYYYGACVDAVTDETDTTNNCSASEQVTVPEPQGHPDLMVGSPSVSEKGPAAGASFTLSAEVRNDGDESAAATTLRYYRSTDATITTSDSEVGTDAIAGLAPAGTSSQSVDLTAPDTAGTYYYGACVDTVTDESHTNNNCSSSVIVTVREPESDEPELMVTPPTVSNSAPAAGSTFTLTVTVESPDADPAATITLSIYRSTDATITTSDTLVGTVEAELDTSETSSQSTILAASTTPGVSYSGKVELTAPDTEGTYYYGACTDTDNCSGSVRMDVKSSLQTNVDLVVGSPSVSDDSPAPFVVFSLSATVRNAGDDSSATTTLRYYRSTDATITTSDTEVGTDSVAGLAPAGTSDQSVDLTAPSSPGTHYYGACVDAVADESDTTNNCSTSVPVNVLVSEPQAQPDLEVGTPTVDDASPETGATITLSATVSNTGSGASEATTLRFYRSTEETITTTHTEVGTDIVGALTASGTSEGSVSVAVPRSMGRYFYGACVDAVADESDTTNNCSAPVTVTVVAPQQPEGAPSVRIYSASSAVTEGMPVRIGVTATPAPTANLDVYLSYTEYARSGGQITYYIWPPLEPKVTIPAGSTSTTLTVSSIDDSDADGNSVLYAWLASGSGYTIDSDPFRRTAFVVVVDDDGPAGDSVLSITAVSTSVSEGTAVQFTVSANPAPTEAVTVGYRVSETGSTFAEALDPGWNPGTVTIGAGESTATLRFNTVDDSTDEEDSDVVVTLRVDTYPDGVELGFPAEAYVTVLDDD